MNIAKRSNTVGLVLLLSGAGCGTGSVGPLPAEPEADSERTSAENALRTLGQPKAGDPLAGLLQADLDRFTAGKEDFEEEETPEDGLGPVFNDISCARCHSDPATGGGSALLETRFGASTASGAFDPLTKYGGALIQANGIGPAGNCNFVAETVPAAATMTSLRRSTPLFGLGLVDAVPESTFTYVARTEAALFPDEAGRVAKVHDIARNADAVGRFGWKAQVPTLHQFGGDAYLNEMGITSPEFPNENCPNGDCSLLACNPAPDVNDDGSGITKVADFMTLLAPSPRAPPTADSLVGRVLFSTVGCSHCHWDTFRTGDSVVKALNHATFHPYSDFLLHDMGSLGDGITQNLATGQLMRTAPLWGLRKITTYLHDGRATTLDAAILAHAGQAKKARDRYAALPNYKKTWLAAFLNSL